MAIKLENYENFAYNFYEDLWNCFLSFISGVQEANAKNIPECTENRENLLSLDSNNTCQKATVWT